MLCANTQCTRKMSTHLLYPMQSPAVCITTSALTLNHSGSAFPSPPAELCAILHPAGRADEATQKGHH